MEPENSGRLKKLDQARLDRLRQGNEGAWTSVIGEVSPYLFAAIARILTSESDRAEAMQEAAAAMVRGIGTFGHAGCNFEAWVVRVAQRSALKILRARRTEKKHKEGCDTVRAQHERAGGHSNILDGRAVERISEDDFNSAVSTSMAELGEPRSTLITLRFYWNFDWDQISIKLQMTVKDTKKLWHSTWQMWMRLLRKELKLPPKPKRQRGEA